MGEIQFVPTEPAVDAWQKLQEMTKRAEELEAENIKLHGQVEFEHAKRNVAEYYLSLVDRYGADQWQRGAGNKDPQEFDEWKREQE